MILNPWSRWYTRFYYLFDFNFAKFVWNIAWASNFFLFFLKKGYQWDMRWIWMLPRGGNIPHGEGSYQRSEALEAAKQRFTALATCLRKHTKDTRKMCSQRHHHNTSGEWIQDTLLQEELDSTRPWRDPHLLAKEGDCTTWTADRPFGSPNGQDPRGTVNSRVDSPDRTGDTVLSVWSLTQSCRVIG